MTYRAAWAFDQNLNPGVVGNYANQAKLLAADVALEAVDASLETHGGIGFAEETGLAQFWNGARVLKTAPLNREMILNYVAEQDLGLPRSLLRRSIRGVTEWHRAEDRWDRRSRGFDRRSDARRDTRRWPPEVLCRSMPTEQRRTNANAHETL